MAAIDLELPPTGARIKHDDMLCAPSAPHAAEERFQRVSVENLAQNTRFIISGPRSFERQYAQLYFSRLLALQAAVVAQANAAWPGVPVVKILDVGEDRDVAVVGTLYKDMKLKPSILDEYTKDKGVKQALGDGSNFCSDGDGLVLEDDGARMVLRGEALNVDELVTGTVVAVRGSAPPGGDFVVNALLPAGLPPQPPLPARDDDAYVALVSGLQLANTHTDPLPLQLLSDFLTGNLGSSHEQALASKVATLVVAGGTVGVLEGLATALPLSKHLDQELQPIRDMDMVVTELAAALPVDVMPGPDDPANVSLPQQPLHPCLFPGAAPYASFKRATNPHQLSVDGVVLLGSSGQNIDDLARYSKGLDRLQLMEATLTWRHLAPTAPDTLSCYPFVDRDPFVLTATPHIYFAGNQPRFETRLLQGPEGTRVRLVCVPAFSTSGTLVLVNLRTLQCQPITFEPRL